ncbi:DeoR/GlpR family DNA-binding transcription regulator [Isoptericola sp. b441]|uniref:Lactose phosphotransferase system repressor n=1 Tax=Actinotalea lenta TaxID=3064654 RepID=A0ABT9D9M1_9CELL|nr:MULTISPECIES: DeoR/GlpR family DNA-binding transcription regulator [unclassified Isoptericola]MDO8105657.1 DeoR/GlpR family DNA-binding transcription regulator [Isoptericola sp. b441]MDO8122362.1 DeoR/GlpR family DNA-binding transcription regulator [Isoptericola sp. b490]
MYATERQQEILSKARLDGRVEVRELADQLDVTPETVRRDLTALERRGLLHRVHGGAIPVERLGFEPAVSEREAVMAAQKERIARAALDELPDGGAIILDAGTTTARLAELLPADRELTVVTHGLPIAMALAGRPHLSVHLLGGVIRGRTLAAVGTWTERDVRDVYADVVFLGINGLTVEQGLTTPDLVEAGVKRALVAAARRTVVLADHTKIGRSEFAHVAPLSAVDTVITDTDLDLELAEEIEQTGTRVIRA